MKPWHRAPQEQSVSDTRNTSGISHMMLMQAVPVTPAPSVCPCL